MVEHDSYPEITESPEDIITIYHLAMRGVGLEYNGMSGQTLALQAAITLEELGHEPATAWVDNHYLQISDRALSPDQPTPEDRYVGLMADLELARREHPDGLRRLGSSFARLVNYDELSTLLDINPVASSMQAQHMLVAACWLQREGWPDMSDYINEAYQTCLQAWADLAQAEPTWAPTIYRDATVTLEFLDRWNNQLQPLPLDLWQSLMKLDKHPSSAVRAAALEAAADLRDCYPDNNRLGRQVSRLARRANLRFIFGRHHTSNAEYTAIQRLSKGTVFDEDLWWPQDMTYLPSPDFLLSIVGKYTKIDYVKDSFARRHKA